MRHELELPFPVSRGILACGADMKAAFALAKGNKAVIFDGFGDLADPDNLARYDKALKHEAGWAEKPPRVIACDLHPEYFSTQFARNIALYLRGSLLFATQHHEAHIAAISADNSIINDVIGIALDGTGYGTDGNIWGGEVFTGSFKKYRRFAHFRYITMPGGEAAIKEPWRMAVSYLYDAFGKSFAGLKLPLIKKVGREKVALVAKIIDKGIYSPLTSSAGRLFDAMGAIVMAHHGIAAEAEVPVRFERLAEKGIEDSYAFDIAKRGPSFEIDFRKTIKAVVKDMIEGKKAGRISAKFHNTIVEVMVKIAVKSKNAAKTNSVVFGGGVFQNRYLSSRAAAALTARGFCVFTAKSLSPNDSSIPLGQIAIVNARA